MKTIIITIAIVITGMVAQAQVGKNDVSNGDGIFKQKYSKEITEYKVKEYIIREILNIPEGELIAVEIDAITASKSGELTTVVYQCDALNKSGVVFVFWQDTWNEYNTEYKGYAFRNIDYKKGQELFAQLDKVIDNKKSIVKDGSTSNATYLWEDLYILFYKEGTSNKIRLFWNGFDAEWNQSNLKTTSRRFSKSLS